MNEYRASSWSGPVESRFGPFEFSRTVFTDSTGRSVECWCCMTSRRGRADARARTRAHALAFWFQLAWEREIMWRVQDWVRWLQEHLK